MSADRIIGCFQQTFAELGPGKDMQLHQLYAEGVVFEDPAHRIEGREALEKYYGRLNAGLRRGRFDFSRTTANATSAALCWKMDLELKFPNKRICVEGVSVIEFDEAVTHQRDYFDLGQLLYEPVPILGSVIRAIRKRFAAS